MRGGAVVQSATESLGIAYHPHRVQSLAHADPRELRWFCAGYGTGKTTVGVIDAFTNAVIHHPGYVGIVAAPTFPLLMQAWFAEWKTWVPQEWWRLRQDPKYGSMLLVRTPTGPTSTILLRSTSNPASNEGVNAAWLVFDEVTREPRKAALDVLHARLRRGYPGRQRSALLTGPPMSRRHWTAIEFGTGPGNGRLGHSRHWCNATHAVVRARTRDNPYLPDGYEAKIRSRPGATAAWCKQFLDAQFGATEGQIFDSFNSDIHVVPAASLAGRKWRHIVVGVDWGYSHPGVMLVVAQDGLENLYVLHEQVHQGKIISDHPDGWITIGQRLAEQFKPSAFLCDPSQPQAMQSLQRGLRRTYKALVYGAENDVAEGIRRVQGMLELRESPLILPGQSRMRPSLVVSDACQHTIGEFESYSRKKDRLGEPTEAPDKRGDDAMDALRYATMHLTAA